MADERAERTRKTDGQPWYIKHGALVIAFSVQFVGAVAWATSLKGDVVRAQGDVSEIKNDIREGQQVISEMPYLKGRIENIEKKVDQSIIEQQKMSNMLARIEAKVS